MNIRGRTKLGKKKKKSFRVNFASSRENAFFAGNSKISRKKPGKYAKKHGNHASKKQTNELDFVERTWSDRNSER